MLVHQHQDSEGAVPPSVKLTSRNVFNSSDSGTVHSGIKLGLSGAASTIQFNGGFSAIIGEWLLSGASSDFFVQRTIISGTLEVDPGNGFLAMSTDRIYDNQKSSFGEKTTEVFFEISSDISGVPVIETATMTFISDKAI